MRHNRRQLSETAILTLFLKFRLTFVLYTLQFEQSESPARSPWRAVKFELGARQFRSIGLQAAPPQIFSHLAHDRVAPASRPCEYSLHNADHWATSHLSCYVVAGASAIESLTTKVTKVHEGFRFDSFVFLRALRGEKVFAAP